MEDIKETIKKLFEENHSLKIISRMVRRRTEYVREVIKEKGLARRHILKRPIRYCAKCNREITNCSSYRYCSRKCAVDHLYETRIKNWLSGGILISSEEVPNYIRRYLFEENNSKCSKCGWGEIHPITKKIPLTINHIDGNCLNNTIDNLELLCPNCHSLTPNYGSLNKGSGRKKRLEKLRNSGPCRT